MIGRYGGYFEEDIRRFMCDRAYRITGFGCTGEVCTNSQGEKVHRRGQQRRKGESAYNPWTQHQSKELIYLLQKFRSHQKFKYYAHAPRGIDWQEKTIARPRPPLIRRTIKEHLMFQICYITFTIRACYRTCKLQHKYCSNSQLLKQHNFNITTSISQNNHQASNFSQYSKHS